ncbi:transcription initiation factor TFIID subunit 6-like [Diorhabda sublineata]|uniref:transcription initiation factor TFIID subunit 6-like n=1 Tax=Diorhabda sublineata TaxID=1163346 RepID=UPI0024E10408|nr:transcription initiation factor TFIID subunit 6-like [Diorhabda sublineata]
MEKKQLQSENTDSTGGTTTQQLVTISPTSFSVNHPLPADRQRFFLSLTEGIFGLDEEVKEEKLQILSVSCTIKDLVPYLCAFIRNTIDMNKGNPDLILFTNSIRMVDNLINNEHLNLTPVLNDLFPAVISCILTRKVSRNCYENHWPLRDFSISLIKTICEKYNNPADNIKNRVIHIYYKPLKDCKIYPLTTLYGAIKGLGSLGEEVIKIFVLPHINNLGKVLFEKPFSSRRLSEANQYAMEVKQVKQAIVNVTAPVLLKMKDANDGKSSYSKKFGYLGKCLYAEIKKLESTNIKK